MIKPYLHSRIAQFEEAWGYNAHHLHWLLEASPTGFAKYALMSPALNHRRGVPGEVHWAAGIEAVLASDCGSCAELVTKFAEADGYRRNGERMGPESNSDLTSEAAAVGRNFARAVLSRDAAAAAELRAHIIKEWGNEALASLGLQIALAGFYPNLKRALSNEEQGEGACSLYGGMVGATAASCQQAQDA